MVEVRLEKGGKLELDFLHPPPLLRFQPVVAGQEDQGRPRLLLSVLMPGPGVDEKLTKLCLGLLGLEDGACDELLVGQPPVIPAGRLEGL